MSRGALSDSEIQSEMNKMVRPPSHPHTADPVRSTNADSRLHSSRRRRARRLGKSRSRPTRSLRLRRWVVCGSRRYQTRLISTTRGADGQAKIVRQESLAIDAQYEKKRKQAEVGWKM